MSNELLGEIIIIKRNGADGARFQLRTPQCTFGSDLECDIRIQIPKVELQHAKLYHEDGKIWLQNLAQDFPTLLNSKAVSSQEVSHKDVFTISERSFRFEFPEKRRSSTPRRQSSNRKTPLMSIQGSPRTPARGESLKKSITKLRRNSAAVTEEDEALASPTKTTPKANSPRKPIFGTPNQQKENTPEEALLHSTTPSILKKQKSARRSEKRISFGPTLSPELFDKTLPPSTPLRKGKSPSRRLSEPLQRITPGKVKAKKRCSLGTALGKMPIMEEEEDQVADSANVPLCDTPPENLPAPLLPSTNGKQDVAPIETPTGKKAATDVVDDGKDAAAGDATPGQKKKQGLLVRRCRMSTPLRHQIHEGIKLAALRRKLKTPLRQQIESKPKLKKTLKRLATPLRKQIESQPSLKKTKKSMPTPVRNAIEAKPILRATKKKLATPLRQQIQEKPKLRATKKKLATPVRDDIRKGLTLRATKRKLKTPLREEIKRGIKLHITKPTLPLVLQNEIKSKPQLKETKKRMRKSLQNEIIQGKELQSKFSGVQRLPEELKAEIQDGKPLKKTFRSISTPLKNEIKDGVELRKTKKIMRKSLQADIAVGKKLRKTKLSAPTPLRNAIKAGTKLRKTKQTAPTPLRREIKKGLNLRATKKKLAEHLQEEIKNGKELKKTKVSAPTPFREEIKKGVKLRQTKKRMYQDLQKEIQEGRPLKKTKKSAPTPLRNEIKRGLKLRPSVNRFAANLHNRTNSETNLMKKSLNTPVRNQIKSGVELRRAPVATTVDEKAFARRKSLRSASKDNNAQMMEIDSAASLFTAEQGRPFLRAKRRLGPKVVPPPVAAFEIPRRLSEKIEKPAKKRACRRSTPKKIAELRYQMQNDKEDDCSIASGVDETLSEQPEVMSPVFNFKSCVIDETTESKPVKPFSDSYMSETSCEDLDASAQIPNIVASCSSPSDNPAAGSATENNSSTENDEDLGLKRLLNTPATGTTNKAREEHYGLGRPIKTPNEREVESSTVVENLGLERLMKTPKEKATMEPDFEGDFGISTLVKTPTERKNEESIAEEKLKRLLKTPKEKRVVEPAVEENFVLASLMKSPREAKMGDSMVEENFGLRRLLRTPKEKKVLEPEIEGDLGLRRLMKTPNENLSPNDSINGELGLRRLMRSPKEAHDPVNSPHLQSLFREPKTREPEMSGNYGLKRLMQTPKDRKEKDRYSIEPGALPAMFKQSKIGQVPVENMDLQQLFVEVEPLPESSEPAYVSRSTRRVAVVTGTSQAQPKGPSRRGKCSKITEETTIETGEVDAKADSFGLDAKSAHDTIVEREEPTNKESIGAEENFFPARKSKRKPQTKKAVKKKKEKCDVVEEKCVDEVAKEGEKNDVQEQNDLKEKKPEECMGTNTRIKRKRGRPVKVENEEIKEHQEERSGNDPTEVLKVVPQRKSRRVTRRNNVTDPDPTPSEDTETEKQMPVNEQDKMRIDVEEPAQPSKTRSSRRRKSLEEIVQQLPKVKAMEMKQELITEDEMERDVSKTGRKGDRSSRRNNAKSATSIDADTDAVKIPNVKNRLASIPEERESHETSAVVLKQELDEVSREEERVEEVQTKRITRNRRDVVVSTERNGSTLVEKNTVKRSSRTRRAARQLASSEEVCVAIELNESEGKESPQVQDMSEVHEEPISNTTERQTRSKRTVSEKNQKKVVVSRSKRKRNMLETEASAPVVSETPESKRTRRGAKSEREAQKPTERRSQRVTRSRAR